MAAPPVEVENASRQPVSGDSGYAGGPVGFAGRAGLVYMLNDAVGLNGEMSYRIQLRRGDDLNEHAMGLSIGVSAFVF
jgi:hypothetical protein